MATYIPSAANDAAVAELVASGFTEAQAKQIVASAKKSPEAVAEEAKRAAAGYVATAGNEELKARLVAAGFTASEAEKIVASGQSVDAVLASLTAMGSSRLNTVVVEELKAQGLSQGVAETLAATGGDLKKLREIAKDPSKVKALVSDIDARLRKEGIDLGARLKDGLGLSDKDMKTAQTVYKAAGAALDVFEGISTLMGAQSSQYIAARWDERLVTSDESFAELARSLQSMAEQSDANRARKTAQYKAGARKVAAGVATAAAFIPVAGPAIAVAVGLVQGGLEALGVYEAKQDDNAPAFKPRAEELSRRLWKEWMLVPPTFNSEYYTLATYGDVCGAVLFHLEESEAETPWRESFYRVVFEAMYQRLGQASPLIDDLVTLHWIPFGISDWMGGTNMIAGSHWNNGGGCTSSGMRAAELPPALCVGGEGVEMPAIASRPSLSSDAFFDCFSYLDGIFNQKAATPEANDGMRLVGGYRKPPFVYQATDPKTMDLLWRTRTIPRGAALQQHICDRMSAALGTIMAIAYGKPVEPLVQAAVVASRKAVVDYGWEPKNAARRLRDTFLTTLATANAIEDLPVARIVSLPIMRPEVVSTALNALDKVAEDVMEKASARKAAKAEAIENFVNSGGLESLNALGGFKMPSFGM